MNQDSADWGARLLFASVCCLLGMTGFVATRSSTDRRMTFGLLGQGILLAFVAGGTYFHHAAELRLGGLIVAVLLLLFSFAGPKNSEREGSAVGKHSP